MAYSPRAQSPGVGSAYPPGTQPRGRSTSPGAAATGPISKRDKRRSALQDRLQDLTATFCQNRDAQFRQQLHSLQCDMTLINNADPYVDGPLADSAEDIAHLIEDTVGGGKFAKEMASLSGTWYAKFVHEVNNIKEKRDAELAQLMNRHENNLERHRREYEFRVHFGTEEFRQMAGTLRERLMQSLDASRERLRKEQVDIADINAATFHPNQYSVTNPTASPGGIQSNRKTRHTRHRVDMDDLGNGIPELNKRKRKAPDGDNGSPVRNPTCTSTAERTKAQLKKQNAPVYSINTLFTDKELTAHANDAHIATLHFFSTSRRAEQGSGAITNGNNTDAEDTPDGTGHEDNGTPSATDMVRTASHNFHATRSTRTTAAQSALSALTDLSDKPARRPALPYNVLSGYTARGNGPAPGPAPLLTEDVDGDLARMERLRNQPSGWMDSALIEMVTAPLPTEQENGHPPNPDRFSAAHPDFPAGVMQMLQLRPQSGEHMLSTGGEAGRSSKRSRHH
ncbi:hypothetical protein N7488_000516 [Penicillium malachiteum]|nr:hypothetical protein N7488_000516 [Penicillium malachiteum]